MSERRIAGMEVQRGCLLLADISGYTKYLAGVELEHSHDIMADLVTLVVSQLAGPFELGKLEGDAVFCFDLDAGTQDRYGVVGLLEECYFSFQRRLFNISHLSTCDCNACLTVPRLSLKFIVHHGQFVVQEVVGRRELIGPDVVVVHRLLKNSVKEKTGLAGYALYTLASVEQLGIDWRSYEMHPFSEGYDDIGEVPAFLHDLESRWKGELEQRTFYIHPGEAGFEVSADLSASPQVLWEMSTSPTKRPHWQPDVIRIDRVDEGAELGVGAISHCVHGSHSVREEIIDWRPYQYYSLRWQTPYGNLVGTVEFLPLGDGRTQVTVRIDPESRAEGRREFTEATKGLKASYEKGLQALGALAKDAASQLSGTVQTP